MNHEIGRLKARAVAVNVTMPCRVSIEDQIPNHSAFSRTRHGRFREADILRRVFEQVVGTCIEEGLVVGAAFSVDASLITADVNRTKRIASDAPITWPEPENASRAVREYLTALDRQSPQASIRADGRKRHPRMVISLIDPQAAWTA